MQLPEDFNAEEAREAWLRHGLGELKFWLQHIDEKTDKLKQEEMQGRFLYLEHAELVFLYSAFLNRLAQISKKTPDNLDINTRLVPWLAKGSGWPEEVAQAFWYCVRNPVIHVGRAWVMADYGLTINGAKLMAGFRLSLLDTKLATEMPKPHGIGWHMIDWGNSVTIYFDFYGLREIADKILHQTADQIRSFDAKELYKLRKVNERIPFFYVGSLDGD